MISSGDVESAVDAINQISGSTGVTASSSGNKVVLFDSDGDDITVENTQTLAGHSDLVVAKLGEDGLVTNVVGQEVSLAVSGGTDATRVTGTLKMVSANPFSIDQKFQTTTNTTNTLVNGAISSGANKVVLDSLTGLGVGTAIRFAGDSVPTTHYYPQLT